MKVLFSVDPYISSVKYGYSQISISSVWIQCDVDSDLPISWLIVPRYNHGVNKWNQQLYNPLGIHIF